MSNNLCPKCGKSRTQGSRHPCSCPSPAPEISGRRFVALLLGGAVLFAAIVLGLFYFYFFDYLKEYRKNVPALPRTTLRG